MAVSTKISDLSTLPASLEMEDLLVVVDDPTGNPSTWQLYISTLKTALTSTMLANGLTATTLTMQGALNGVTSFQTSTLTGYSVSVSTLSVSTATAGGNLMEAFPQSTFMLFVSTTAPPGWTKDSTHNDKALRVVTGTASSGGTVAFETAFASQAVTGTNGNVGATALTVAQMPVHTHAQSWADGAATSIWWTGAGSGSGPANSPKNVDSNTWDTTVVSTQPSGSGATHTHSGSVFTGDAINLDVQFVDVIIAGKD